MSSQPEDVRLQPVNSGQQSQQQQPPPPPPYYQYPQQQTQQYPPSQPPPPHHPQQASQPPQKKAGKGMIIALIVIVIVVIAALAGAMMMSGGAKSTLKQFVEKVNDNDATAAVNLTTDKFSDDYGDAIDELEYAIASLEQITIIDIETTNKEDLSSTEQSDIEDYIADLEIDLGVVVDDYCIVKATLKFEYYDHDDTDTNDTLFVKINGKWYMDMIWN